MLIEIKNRYTGDVLFSHDQENNTIKITVELAVKTQANLSGADLSWANLSGADLSRADLSWANLIGANMSWADLSRADLSEANLSRANLSRANLSWANLSRSDLSGANLSRADLSWADLSEANLSWANLSRSDLNRADLSGANLSWAYLSGTIGNMKEIVSIIVDTYPIAITKDIIQIGCKRHSYAEWEKFDDFAIMQMDGARAKEFWDTWKDIILKTYLLKFGEK